ncbi:PilZ domain-containing protein [Thermodesulfobacteriota bacterium]
MVEKRKFERFSVELSAAYANEPDGERVTCSIVELSQEGLRLNMYEKIQFGQALPLEVLLPGSDEPLRIVMTVRWSKQLYDNSGFDYLAGGELAAPDADTIQKLIAYAQETA